MDSYFESYGTANDARSSKRILITASGFINSAEELPCSSGHPTTGFTSVCGRPCLPGPALAPDELRKKRAAASLWRAGTIVWLSHGALLLRLRPQWPICRNG